MTEATVIHRSTDIDRIDRCNCSQESEPVRDGKQGVFSNMASLTLVLRIIGAGLVLASASIFMLQRWETGNDISRYAMLLGHTVFLCAFGFFCGLRLNESRSARVLFGLVLSSVPVHFTVLGGLLYSQFQWDLTSQAVPLHALWVAPSALSALVTLLVACIVLTPLCYISMLTLARPHAGSLTIFYLLINAVILLPFRSADLIGILAAILSIGLIQLELRHLSSKAALNTVGGYFIRLMMLLPLGIIIGRSINLYDLTVMFFGFICIGFSVSVFMLVPRYLKEQSDQVVFQSACAFVAVFGVCLVSYGIVDSGHFTASIVLPLYVLPCAAVLLILSFLCVGSGERYRDITACLTVAFMGYNLSAHPGVLPALICLVMSSAAAAYAAFTRNKTVLLTGAMGFLVGLSYHMYYAISVGKIVNWSSLTLVGGGLIIIASIFERNAGRILQKIEAARARFGSESSNE